MYIQNLDERCIYAALHESYQGAHSIILLPPTNMHSDAYMLRTARYMQGGPRKSHTLWLYLLGRMERRRLPGPETPFGIDINIKTYLTWQSHMRGAVPYLSMFKLGNQLKRIIIFQVVPIRVNALPITVFLVHMHGAFDVFRQLGQKVLSS